MTDPKPMDPARLAALDHEASLMRVSMIPDSVLAVGQLIRELIEAHRYWETKVKFYRARCTIKAADVESAGVTWSQVLAWAKAQDLVPCDAEFDTWDQPDDYAMLRLRRPDSKHECDAVFELTDGEHARSTAYSCNTLARAYGRPAFDILDEIAASEPGTTRPADG